MPDLTKEREAFEAWASAPENGWPIDRVGVEQVYRSPATHAAWCAWQDRAALSTPAVPPGYVLVPVEPTIDQESAGCCAMRRHSTLGGACRVYKAMLAAAPQQPAVQAPCGNRENCSRFPFCGCGEPDQLPERDPSKPAEAQGLFRKFTVTRTDGSDQPGGKHEGCEYFVLDVDHDPHAKAALLAYAEACQETHPKLSRDLRERWGPLQGPAVQSKPIERDESMQRDYIPLPGGWEVQTKGNGSTMRLLDKKAGERHPLMEPQHVLDFIERMAREIHAAVSGPAVQGGAQDAARYRWLVTRPCDGDDHYYIATEDGSEANLDGWWALGGDLAKERADAYIDAAMAQEGGK